MMSVVDEILETIRYSHERFVRSTIKWKTMLFLMMWEIS
jgi:hypothetical protein